MAGAFTHICIVNEVLNRIKTLTDDQFPEEIKNHLIANKPFLEVGSVSPDYPLLDFRSQDANNWSGLMHTVLTGSFLQEGAHRARKIGYSIRGKYIAWFLGYLSHYTADLVVHPVVEQLVGHYYDGNQVEHRECEMHQDVFIVKEIFKKELIEAEILDSSVIQCSECGNRKLLDISLRMIWLDLLKSVYPNFFYVCVPEIDTWHEKYVSRIDRYAEEGGHLFGFARLLTSYGVSYPWVSDLEDRFYKKLPGPILPTGPTDPIDFIDLFEKAVKQCIVNFTDFANFITKRTERITIPLGNYSMDTGKDENGNFVYWQ